MQTGEISDPCHYPHLLKRPGGSDSRKHGNQLCIWIDLHVSTILF